MCGDANNFEVPISETEELWRMGFKADERSSIYAVADYYGMLTHHVALRFDFEQEIAKMLSQFALPLAILAFCKINPTSRAMCN